MPGTLLQAGIGKTAFGNKGWAGTAYITSGASSAQVTVGLVSNKTSVLVQPSVATPYGLIEVSASRIHGNHGKIVVSTPGGLNTTGDTNFSFYGFNQ